MYSSDYFLIEHVIPYEQAVFWRKQTDKNILQFGMIAQNVGISKLPSGVVHFTGWLPVRTDRVASIRFAIPVKNFRLWLEASYRGQEYLDIITPKSIGIGGIREISFTDGIPTVSAKYSVKFEYDCLPDMVPGIENMEIDEIRQLQLLYPVFGAQLLSPKMKERIIREQEDIETGKSQLELRIGIYYKGHSFAGFTRKLNICDFLSFAERMADERVF